MTTHRESRGTVPSPWVGWVTFAAAVLAASGIVHIVVGLVAVMRTAGLNLSTMPLIADYRGLGWTMLVLGVLLLATGGGVMTGRMWARVAGVVIVALSVLGNLAWFAVFPIWSAIAIVLGVVAIYAIVAHGGELRKS